MIKKLLTYLLRLTYLNDEIPRPKPNEPKDAYLLRVGYMSIQHHTKRISKAESTWRDTQAKEVNKTFCEIYNKSKLKDGKL